MSLTVGAALDGARQRLTQSGVESARHDAEALLAWVLGTARGRLRHDAVLDEEEARRFRAAVERRAGREPLQHILGRAPFRHLDLLVGPGVFVPRPESELVAGLAIDELRRVQRGGDPSPLAVDLCTGSGAIALALATEVPGARVVAVEASAKAHGYAVRNAGGRPVDVRLGDIATAVDDLAGQAAVVTANPPYVAETEADLVAPEVRLFDPPGALWAGADGLDVVRVVERVAARLLLSGGLVVCEHSDRQGDSAPAVFSGTGCWSEVADHTDLTGRARYVSARRR